MLRKNFLSLAIVASISIPAIAADLVPEEFADFRNNVVSQCNNIDVGSCPDDANIEALVLEISNADQAMADAQASLDANTDPALEEGLNESLASATAVVDSLNAKAELYKQSDALAKVFDYYDAERNIVETNTKIVGLNNNIGNTEDELENATNAKGVADNELIIAEDDRDTAKTTYDGLNSADPKDEAAVAVALDDYVAQLKNVEEKASDVAEAQDLVASITANLASLNAELADATNTLGDLNGSIAGLDESAKEAMTTVDKHLDQKAVYTDIEKNDAIATKASADEALIEAQIAVDSAQGEADDAVAAEGVATGAVTTAEDALANAKVALAANTDPTLIAGLIAEVDAAEADLVAKEGELTAAQELVTSTANALDLRKTELNNASTGVTTAEGALNTATIAATAAVNANDANVAFLDGTSSEIADMRNSFINGEGEAEAIIEAVDSNYKETLTNAAAITAGDEANAAAITAGDEANAASIAANVTAIQSNDADIATNATGIAANVTDIATNASGIAANVTDIATNASGIAANVTDIATNASGIAANVTDIATNASGIAANVTDIATNASGIAANVTAIQSNDADIATNSSGIAANVTSIDNNASAIANNGASIDDLERSMAVNVDMLKSGIASSLAIAGMPTATGEGFGLSIGVGYFEGENAAAMGLSHVSAGRTIKLSVGHANGNTSGSLGAAFKF